MLFRSEIESVEIVFKNGVGYYSKKLMNRQEVTSESVDSYMRLGEWKNKIAGPELQS